MANKPFPFSVCEQCCSADVSAEDIANAVEEYLTENPVETIKLVAESDIDSIFDGGIYRISHKTPIATYYELLFVSRINYEEALQARMTAGGIVTRNSYINEVYDEETGMTIAVPTWETEWKEQKAETILREVTVNTEPWTNQPTHSENIDTMFTVGTVYYVTLKETDGSILKDGQFKLMDFVGEYATAYNSVFTITNLETGTAGTLTENMPCEFTEDYLLRNAGVNMVTLTLNKDMDFTLNVKVTALGEFIKTDSTDYIGVYYSTDKNVSNYHSGTTTTWNSDAGKNIWHYINQGNDASKIHKFRDEFSISKKTDNHFATERKHLSRVLPYGTTTYKNYTAQTIGFGKADTGTTLKNAVLYSVRQTGFIRNGTVIRVTEVK